MRGPKQPTAMTKKSATVIIFATAHGHIVVTTDWDSTAKPRATMCQGGNREKNVKVSPSGVTDSPESSNAAP